MGVHIVQYMCAVLNTDNVARGGILCNNRLWMCGSYLKELVFFLRTYIVISSDFVFADLVNSSELVFLPT